MEQHRVVYNEQERMTLEHQQSVTGALWTQDDVLCVDMKFFEATSCARVTSVALRAPFVTRAQDVAE